MKTLLFLLFAGVPVFRLTSVTVLNTDALVARTAVFSLDGSRAAYLSNGHLYVMDIASRITRDAGPWVRAGESLAFAPDGQSMYVGRGGLQQRSLAGGPWRKIADGAGPVLSPDGKTLSLLRRTPPSIALVLTDPDGSHERKLTVPWTILSWAWSADSSTIAVLQWQFYGPGKAKSISIPDHDWSKVQDSAGLSGLRRASPDGWTLAAHRQRVVRDFWDSFLHVAGLSAGKLVDELVLIKISK